MYKIKNQQLPKSKENNENYLESDYECDENEFKLLLKNLKKHRPKFSITLKEIEIKMNRVREEEEEENKYKEKNDLNQTTNMSINNEAKNKKILEFIIDNSDFSFLQFKVLFITLLIIGFEGMQLPFTSLMLIPLREYYKMNELQVQFSGAIIFVGVSIGSALLHPFTENYGRVFTMSLFTILSVLTSLVLVFATNYYIFLVMRLLLGVSLGILEPAVLSTLCEYLPLKLRSFALTMIWCGGAIGIGVLYIGMNVFMPQYNIRKIEVVFYVCFLYIAFVAFFTYYFYFDSPRHLIMKGEYKKAFKLLQEITGRPFSQELKQAIIEDGKDGQQNTENEKVDISDLFSDKQNFTSICLGIIWIGVNLALYGPIQISSISIKMLQPDMDSQGILFAQFISGFFLFMSIIVGSILSEIRFFGRRLTMVLSFLLSIIVSFFIWIFPHHLSTILCFIGLIFGVGGNVSITYTAEYYNTKQRDLALGFFFMLSRVACFISQFVFLWSLNISAVFPFYLLTFIYIIIFIFSFTLPYETYGKPLDIEIKPMSLIDRLTKYNKPIEIEDNEIDN